MAGKFRNPFKLRASEKIESDVRFLQLFSPLVIDALVEKNKSGKLWGNVLLIHSSPGGGKTSLIKVFEPNSLRTLFSSKSASEYRPLYTALKKIDVINDGGVEVLGVTIPCTRNYQILEELSVSKAQKARLFFSLINSRIILATLRSACKLKGKKFPDDLKDFSFDYNNSDNYFKTIHVPCNGKELYDWASQLERVIYKQIDSFIPAENIEIEGHDEMISLITLTPENLLLDGEKICSKILFMFDDVHKLSIEQRTMFKKYIIEKRSDVNIWISERLEALESRDHLGSFQGRDFEILNLENFWNKNQAKLSKILKNISEKRAGISTEDISSFQEYLNENLNEEAIRKKLDLIIVETKTKLNEIAKFTEKFDNWISYAIDYNEGSLETAIFLKEVEILVHRNIGKEQLTFEFPLTVDELEQKRSNDVRNAAVLFMSMDNSISYYYGFKTLVKLSSFNIEQFLAFSAEMFEEMISNKIKGNDIVLSDRIQDDIIRKLARKNWKKINTEIPYSRDVQKFLKSLGDYCISQTFKPNAPYSPGVNGFSIKLKNNQTLFEEVHWLDDEIYDPLVNVISTCVAYNLLEKHTTHQGKKGQSWEVYYLNRWLCVLFGLPISYGGFRHRTPEQLILWMKK